MLICTVSFTSNNVCSQAANLFLGPETTQLNCIQSGTVKEAKRQYDGFIQVQNLDRLNLKIRLVKKTCVAATADKFEETNLPRNDCSYSQLCAIQAVNLMPSEQYRFLMI